MRLKKIIEEDLSHYKDYCLLLFAPNCSWKCCLEKDISIESCANHCFQKTETSIYNNETIIKTFIDNPLHKALCIAGAEPLDSDDLRGFIRYFRERNDSKIIVFTGYKEQEIQAKSFIEWVKNNDITDVVLKVGRYTPGDESHLDPILGIALCSTNQYAIQIN